MPTASMPARTKTVETRTLEEVPVSESGGLGCLPLEYLLNCSEDELVIANVRIYRYDPGTAGVFLIKLDPAQRIDESWIGEKFGGGTYGVKVYSKNGKSGFDRAVRIDTRTYGPAKDGSLQTSANGAPPPAPAPAPQVSGMETAFNRFADMMERQNERLESMMNRAFERQQYEKPAAPANPIAEMGFKAALDMVTTSARATIESVQSLVKPAPAGDNEDKFLERMLKYKELFGAPAVQAGASGSMIEQVTQLGSLIDIVEKIRGKGGSEADWKSVLVEKGLDHVPELVEFGKTILTQRSREGEMAVRREQARAAAVQSIERLRNNGGLPGIPGQPGPTPGMPATGAAVSTAAQASPTADEGFSALRVVPISGDPAAPAVEIIPPGADIDGGVSTESEQIVQQKFVKETIVRLVKEGDDPANILDFIDRSMPLAGRYLTGLKEEKVKEFIEQDEILREIATFPHYRKFLSEFMQVLNEEPIEPEAPERAN